MRLFFIPPLLLSITSIVPLLAAPNPATNEICQAAKDYWGCVRAMDGISSELRQIGPLQVDWSVWRKVNGSYIVPAFNSSGNGFYLAINCSRGKINVSGREGVWKGWNSPVKGFEYELVEEFCDQANSP